MTAPPRPPSAVPTLGILGGGQLGRMTALAAIRMGLRVKILTPDAAGPEAPFAAVTVADWTQPDVLARWMQGCTAVTVESEWAPADRLAALDGAPPVRPTPDTLRLIRHKGRQRLALRDAGLPGPEFVLASTPDEAWEATERFGGRAVLKRFEGSYDGYGNATVASRSEVEASWPKLAAEPGDGEPGGLLVEAFVPFVSELSVIVARRADGAHVAYPVALTEQRDHRCHAVTLPAGLAPEVEAEAHRVALGAVEAVDGVGIVAVELFLTDDGRALINELAPRPHNTGHVTIEASHTSQFENHVRAVLGLPLGDPALRVPAACMVNVLGYTDGPGFPDGMREALAVPGAAIHLYGKTGSRPRRKMGHVTVTAATPAEARAQAEAAAAALRL